MFLLCQELERNGTKFYDNGIEQDGLTILKNHGVNWIRVRIWNNPYVVGPEGVGGGNTDEAKAIEMAKRAKALGMKVLVDFHYNVLGGPRSTEKTGCLEK